MESAVNQSKKSSLLEVVLNTSTGFVTAMVTWQLIASPLFGYNVTLYQNFWLTMIFTIVSIVRSYMWRRAFNYYLTRKTEHGKANFREWCNKGH